jgi:hypothetical protein
MLNENQATLDSLNNKNKLLPIISKLLILLVIIGLSYLAYFSTTTPSREVSRIEETGKFKAEASARGSRNFCSIELNNLQIITLACSSNSYRVDQEVKLFKVTNEKTNYYEMQDEVTETLKTLTSHSSGTPSGAP